MGFVRLAAIAAAFAALTGLSQPPRYADGQVWEYRGRPADAGSLLKIQRIETGVKEPVYHISVIGLNLAGSPDQVLQHTPVTAETLDASVTRLAPPGTPFPEIDFESGIAQWRQAKGGVFTIPVAEIADIIDGQIAAIPED